MPPPLNLLRLPSHLASAVARCVHSLLLSRTLGRQPFMRRPTLPSLRTRALRAQEWQLSDAWREANGRPALARELAEFIR